MIRFAIIGHRAATTPDFSLNDMPGGAGRMDVLCRCINSSLFLSHGLRREVECYIVLLGEPQPPRTILFSGEKVRYLNPDERSAGSLIKKALAIPASTNFSQSTRGVYVRKGGLAELLDEHQFALLDEKGGDIRQERSLPDSYLLSDHLNLSPEEAALVTGSNSYSVGPRALHADHAITLVLNEIDRRWAVSP